MGLLDKKKSLLTDEQSHWGDVANRLGADISNYGGSALRGLLKGTVGLPVGLHNLVSDVTGRGSQIDTLSPEWVGKKVEPYLPAGNTKTEIGGEFINPLGVMKAASIPLMGLMFAGKGAKTADLFKLREAEEMLKKGVSDRDAYAQTGWTHGFADKKPRFEIDDSGSSVKNLPKSEHEFILDEEALKYGENHPLQPGRRPRATREEHQDYKDWLSATRDKYSATNSTTRPLSEVYDNPLVSEAYPDLMKNMKAQQDFL